MNDSRQRQHHAAFLLAAMALICGSYFLPLLLPGDFVTARYAHSHVALDAELEGHLRSLYGEERGFFRYLADLATLNWGYSRAFQSPVSTLILSALPWTLLLMGSAHLASMIAGFIAGVEAAWRRGSRLEKTGIGSMTVLQGIPELGTGALLLLVFSLHLGWFPAAGGETAYASHQGTHRFLDLAHHLALPFFTLVIAYLPGNFLLTRASMVLILKQQYLETARAKGLSSLRIRYAHAARNALLPMVTRFGLRIAFMVTGVLVVESLFAYPGLGTLLYNAIGMRDVPLIQGIVLFSSLMVLGINLLLDALYGRIDPRVKHAS